MLSDKEMYDWSPSVGDRIEVILSSGHVHARGWLIARDSERCFLHCDGIKGLPGYPGMEEWTATFRPDQVRREQTPADNLEKVVWRLTREDKPITRWWRSKKDDPRQRELDLATAYAVISQYRSMHQPVNIADQIITETDDGLTPGDQVRIFIRERNETGFGTFVAEFRGKRHVIFVSGGPAAYPKEDVTPKK